MTSTFTVYWAGVGTVVVALVGGFGGGMLVADRLSSSGSVPAPGKSRLAQVMADYERPKPVHVETPESLQPAVPPKSVDEPKSGAEVLEVQNPRRRARSANEGADVRLGRRISPCRGAVGSSSA